VECDDQDGKNKYQSFYQRKLVQFKNTLSKDEEGRKILQIFIYQEEIMAQLSQLYKDLRTLKVPRKKKLPYIMEWTNPGGPFHQLQQLPTSVPLPIDPTIEVTGILAGAFKVYYD
jgi:hypothetical protein